MCPVVGLGIVSISAAALYMLYHGLAQWRILPEHVREYLYISRHKPSYTEPRYIQAQLHRTEEQTLLHSTKAQMQLSGSVDSREPPNKIKQNKLARQT